jgi:hypothetical protein
MAITYEPIATTTLSTATATITFSSIPSTYTDLIFIGQVKATAGGEQVYIQFNNATASGYSFTYLYGNGSTAGSSRQINSNRINIGNSSTTTTFDNTFVIHINNYANTSVYKNALYRSNNSSLNVETGIGLWQDTSAINRVDFKLTGSQTYASGSTFTLYGIKAA